MVISLFNNLKLSIIGTSNENKIMLCKAIKSIGVYSHDYETIKIYCADLDTFSFSKTT